MLSLAAHAQSPGAPSGRVPPGRTVDSDQTDSIDHMIAFVGLNATLAGAASVCVPPHADFIRQCTQIALQHWPESSGLAAIDNPTAASKLALQIWNGAFKKAHDLQSALNPPLDCPTVMEHASRAPALAVCKIQADPSAPSSLPSTGSRSNPGPQGPVQTQPSTQQPAQQPAQPPAQPPRSPYNMKFQ